MRSNTRQQFIIKLLYILLLCAPFIVNAQVFAPPPPTANVMRLKNGKPVMLDSTRQLTVAKWDSIKNIRVSDQEILIYLRSTPNFGDTTGKRQELVQVITAAKVAELVGLDSYDAALAKAEENYRRRNLVDKVLVVKHERKMYLQKKGITIKTFKVALGPNPVGQREYEGDGKTPEGIYTLDWTKWIGNNFSSYHISYPSEADITRAKNKGLTAGSNIMVHGTNGVKKKKDWTNGCIALTNADLNLFKNMVFQNTVIEILK